MSSAYFFGLLKNAAFASLISLYFCVRALLMLIFSRRLICFFPLRAHSPKKINDASFHPISVLTTGLKKKKTRFLKTAHLYSLLYTYAHTDYNNNILRFTRCANLNKIIKMLRTELYTLTLSRVN